MVSEPPFPNERPDEDTLPAGNQYELVDLSVLDDEQTREQIWTCLNEQEP